MNRGEIMTTLLDMAEKISRVATVVEDIREDTLPRMDEKIDSINDTVIRIDSKHNKDIIRIEDEREKDREEARKNKDTWDRYQEDVNRRMNVLERAREKTQEEKAQRRKEIFSSFLSVTTKLSLALLVYLLSYFISKEFLLEIIDKI